ncbi:hypothetical protein AGMMS49983_17450 [Clostridia bacterium]|nr:hypothetical protein AGMMS49983_17450 [Clostridia bacterium]
MKKRMRFIAFVVTAVFLLAFPGAAFAAQDGAAAGDNITVEYRYAEGQTPDIPASISQFGQTYNLIGTSGAVLESTLPTTRNYTYRVSGAVTPAQLAEIQGAGDVAFTPVYIDKAEEVNEPYTFENLPTNDVDALLEEAQRRGIAGNLIVGTDAGVNHVDVYEVSDVSYEVTARDAITNLPSRYTANCNLRGLKVTQELGYYLANATFTTSEAEDEINQYVVVAEYAPDALPLIVEEEEPVAQTEEVEEPIEPEAPLPTVGLSDDDVALVAGQGNNPIANVVNGLVPLGGLGVSGVWSFLSLFLSAAGVIIAVALALGALARRGRIRNYESLGVYDRENFELVKKRGNLLRALTILVGVLTLVTWVILDDFSLGMVWINNHTLLIGALFVVTVILCALTNARNAKTDRYVTEEPDTEIA